MKPEDGSDSGQRRAFLTAFDYGWGAVYAYVLADAPQDIINRFFPDATVVAEPPPWLEGADLTTLPVQDIDDETGFLGDLLRELGERRAEAHEQ